jgi:hypothetical protein
MYAVIAGFAILLLFVLKSRTSKMGMSYYDMQQEAVLPPPSMEITDSSPGVFVTPSPGSVSNGETPAPSMEITGSSPGVFVTPSSPSYNPATGSDVTTPTIPVSLLPALDEGGSGDIEGFNLEQ